MYSNINVSARLHSEQESIKHTAVHSWPRCTGKFALIICIIVLADRKHSATPHCPNSCMYFVNILRPIVINVHFQYTVLYCSCEIQYEDSVYSELFALWIQVKKAHIMLFVWYVLVTSVLYPVFHYYVNRCYLSIVQKEQTCCILHFICHGRASNSILWLHTVFFISSFTESLLQVVLVMMGLEREPKSIHTICLTRSIPFALYYSFDGG